MKIVFVFITILSFLSVFPLGFWIYRSKRRWRKGVLSGCLLLALLSGLFFSQNLSSITADTSLLNAQVIFTRANFEGSMAVQSIKADDATPLWRQSFKIFNGSVVSATLQGKILFFLWRDQESNDLLFSALRVVDGKEVWRHVLGSLQVPPQIKPVIVQDRVFIGMNGPEGGLLSAFRVSDGKNLWNHHVPTIGTGISLPDSRNLIVLATDQDQVYVMVLGVGLLTLRASDGSEIWHNSGQAFMQISNGIVYQVHFTESSGFTSVTALRASDGKNLWTQHFAQIEGIKREDDHLYVTNFIYDGDQSKIFLDALDSTTGKILWKDQLKDTYDELLLSNGILYLTDLENLEAIRETDGSLVWTTKTTDTTFQFSHLVLYRDTLFVTTSQVGTEGFFFCLGPCPVTQRIYAINAKNGSVRWEYHPPVVSASEGFIQIGTS